MTTVKYVIRISLQFTLLAIFLFIFGVPSIKRYLQGKVLVLESNNNTGGIPAPSVTICGYSQSQYAWKEHSSLKQVLNSCNRSNDVFACVQSKAWNFKDMIFGAYRGYTLNEDLMNSSIWNSLVFKRLSSCYTIRIDYKIATN